MSASFAELREKAGLSIQDIADITGYTSRTVYRWDNNKTIPKKAVFSMLLQRIKNAAREDYKKETNFTFIDLFAGIGGMRMGFESIGGECIFTSEWNKYSRQTYQANYDCTHPIVGDITKIAETDIPSHDLLVAGFPCQPFSIAGVSKKNALGKPHGFRDATQGTLFFDVARILDYHRPKAFLLENVKNLVSHDKGNTFRVIKETLTKIGYTISYKILDARRFVPQHRERIFIVGFREDVSFSMDNVILPKLEDAPLLSTILHSEDGLEQAETPYTLGELAQINEKYTLSDKLWNYLQAYAEKHRKKGNGFGFGLTDGEGYARTLSARYYKDGSEILIRQKNSNPRRLTPRECARLMGFDRTRQASFDIPVSDTQAYRQFGNAVVVPVIEAIAQQMKVYLETKPTIATTKKERLLPVA